MASSITSYLPPGDGLLPKWLLFISIVSIGNSIQAYMSLSGTQQVYAGPSATTPTTGIPSKTIRAESLSPVTPLSARTFGTWTALSSIIRLYAAYRINEPVVYELALWTFGLAFAHFISEWLIFGTARWGRGLIGPIALKYASGQHLEAFVCGASRLRSLGVAVPPPSTPADQNTFPTSKKMFSRPTWDSNPQPSA
ncbi:hypothetical protein AMS68_006124 [Peltaster fructicola]|uniref:Ergosterol biosynthesis protein n=1 Tax=Peltaster fructicola TaxID=286661 RepID=A0A6H0Y0S6_9PEZI|nr:hypothetical protein AMS68_006124 [Peltaster fructicola]